MQLARTPTITFVNFLQILLESKKVTLLFMIEKQQTRIFVVETDHYSLFIYSPLYSSKLLWNWKFNFYEHLQSENKGRFLLRAFQNSELQTQFVAVEVVVIVRI